MLPLSENPKTGRISVKIKGAPGQRAQKIALGTTSRAVARKLVKDAGLEDIELAARANVLTAEAITRLKAGKRVSVEAALKEHLELMPIRGKRASTIKHDTAVLNNWIDVMNLAKAPIGAIEDKHVSKFINNKSRGKYQTRVRQLSSIRTFLGFCLDRGWVATNPATLVAVSVDGMSQEDLLETETLTFTEDEVKKILAHTTGFWHSATIIGRHTGLRLSDVATLQWESITATRLTVFSSKGKRIVDMELTPELKRLFASIPRGDSRYVFPSQAANVITMGSTTTISQQFRRMCIKLGIEDKSFSGLRHTFAVSSMADVTDKKLKLVQEMIGAASIEEVRRLLGHAKSNVTLRYLSHPQK